MSAWSDYHARAMYARMLIVYVRGYARLNINATVVLSYCFLLICTHVQAFINAYM